MKVRLGRCGLLALFGVARSCAETSNGGPYPYGVAANKKVEYPPEILAEFQGAAYSGIPVPRYAAAATSTTKGSLGALK